MSSSMSGLRIAAMGECMAEFAPLSSSGYQLGFAGDTYNTAVYLKRLLGNYHAVSYVTCVGDDDLSVQMLDHIREEGIDTKLCFVEKGASIGAYLISNTDKGERRFTYWRKHSAATYLLDNKRYDTLLRDLARFDLIYVSGISLAILTSENRQRLLSLLRELDVPLAFDPNYRPQLWRDVDEASEVCANTAAISQYLLTTYDDDQQMWGVDSPMAALKYWQSHSNAEIVIKNGSNEAFFSEGSHRDTPAPSVTAPSSIAPSRTIAPKDTTGAGDSFNAAYLASRLRGENMQTAVAKAHDLAAQVITFQGAILPIGSHRSN
jgi:2-dehydro-3-deoxygluconokinase